MENKQTTAMQKLIDEIVEHLTYDDDLDKSSRITLETIRLSCLTKLAMEKEQMIKFANDFLFHDDTDLTAEQYYNETYGQNRD
jgi:hypothetical protein